jgi:hypothetical protein
LRALFRGHLRGGETRKLELLNSRIVAGDDVRERRIANHRSRATRIRQQLDELTAQVFLRREQAKAGIGAGEHFGGIRADEQRRDDRRLPRHLGDIDGQMMAFEAPGPRRTCRRLAEHRGVIQPGIATRGIHARFGLHATQNVFVLHDAARRQQSLGG